MMQCNSPRFVSRNTLTLQNDVERSDASKYIHDLTSRALSEITTSIDGPSELT
jgi:hypothetical protein